MCVGRELINNTRDKRREPNQGAKNTASFYDGTAHLHVQRLDRMGGKRGECFAQKQTAFVTEPSPPH